jgi:hypothetical protein
MIKNFFRFLYWKFWDFRHPQPKRPYGITCFIGLEGYGKTLSLVEKLFRLKAEFPLAKIYTNFFWEYQDGALDDWRQLVEIDNGENGTIFALDEISTIWDRKDQKLDKRMLETFRQNRKYAKMLIGTAQSFLDIHIDVRRRCREIIECRNIGARWVFQRAFHPEDFKEKDGELTPRRRLWRYNFIATNFIYDAYRTYDVIQSIGQEIDKERAAQSAAASSRDSDAYTLSKDTHKTTKINVLELSDREIRRLC